MENSTHLPLHRDFKQWMYAIEPGQERNGLFLAFGNGTCVIHITAIRPTAGIK